MSSPKPFPRIKEIRSYVVDGVGSGGDYHNVARGHWLVLPPDESGHFINHNIRNIGDLSSESSSED